MATVGSSEEAKQKDVTKIKSLLIATLGAKFAINCCVCACSCDQSVSSAEDWINRNILWIGVYRGNDQVVTAALSMIHEVSMCPTCYSQHRWGKPLTARFIEHMKKVLKNSDGWQYSLPPQPVSLPFGANLDDEPPRYHSMSRQGLREVLGLTQIDIQGCNFGWLGPSEGCPTKQKVAVEPNLTFGVINLHLGILAGEIRIEFRLEYVYEATLCAPCKSRAQEQKQVFVKQSLEILTNPAWTEFHALDQERLEINRAQSKFNSLARMDEISEDYRMLLELRGRLLESKDPKFISSFFQMAEELKSPQGCTGGGPGAPLKYDHGGGAGEELHGV